MTAMFKIKLSKMACQFKSKILNMDRAECAWAAFECPSLFTGTRGEGWRSQPGVLVSISQGKASHRKHIDNPPRTLPHNKLFEIRQPVILFHIKVTLKERLKSQVYLICTYLPSLTGFNHFDNLLINKIYILKGSQWSPIPKSNPDNRCANEYAKQSRGNSLDHRDGCLALGVTQPAP